jgi:2-methylcitrate dehydratase PrpD
MTDETRTLAKYAAGLSYNDIPPSIRTHAIDLLVDQIGVQLGCSELPWAQQVRTTYRQPGGAAEATVVRYGDRLPIGATVFINSVFGHSFEYDDANPLCHGHPGAVLIPPLMAIAERDHISGRDFLTALVAGYEVSGRIGWAVSPDMLELGGPHYVTTCGPFGVAAGVGRLVRADPELVKNAMGIAGTFSGGLRQYDYGGGSAKRLFTAVAASSGVQAFYLAQAGITGPDEILEGPHGLLRQYSNEYRPDRLTVDLGRTWMMEYVLFKPYSCCAVIHPAIDALLTILSDTGLDAERIESIEVGYSRVSYDHAAITTPKDLLGLQFSTSYSLAITVLKRRNTPREYTMETLYDPQVKAVAAKVRLNRESKLDQLMADGHMAARITLRSKDGQVFEKLIEDAKGSQASTFTSDDVDAKFNSQVMDVMGAEATQRLIRTLRGIDNISDMSIVPKMLVTTT